MYRRLTFVLLAASICAYAASSAADTSKSDEVAMIMQTVKEFDFNPIKDGRSYEPSLDHDGVANLSDEAWRVRLLAIRDLVRLGASAIPQLTQYLNEENPHVRHVAAFVLGMMRTPESEEALLNTLRHDEDPVVRSQAAISLGQLKSEAAVTVLNELAKSDTSRDVRHQCELAAYRITQYKGPEVDLAAAYGKLDDSTFEKIRVGEPAIDFELTDTSGKPWRLSDFRGKKDVVLIWIFADWCPVCHGEFRDLVEMKDKIASKNVEIVTVECHDLFRSRVMVGDEYQPEYWFSKTSPQGFYEGKIWWRHLADVAGAVGATYGVQPMEFVVHAEWINRPATIIVDKDGIVRFAYYGTYWGDRPTIEETLAMVERRDFTFVHPKRLSVSP